MKTGKIRRIFLSTTSESGPAYVEVYRMEECIPNKGASSAEMKTGLIPKS